MMQQIHCISLYFGLEQISFNSDICGWLDRRLSGKPEVVIAAKC
jgi:hypothetical protein